MYGNVETALDKAWGPGEGSAPPPPDEDPYEPLDPSPPPAPPPKARPSPPRLALVASVALVALLVTSLLLLGTLGARRVSALEAALEAEKAKEPPAPPASGSFLLFNQPHSGCAQPSGPWLTVAACAPSSPAQRFQWLPGGLLRHVATGHCLGATKAAPNALVKLSPCLEGSRLQRWGCGPGALLALAGTALHFNFGHDKHRRVLLCTGSGEWSRWRAHGSDRDVCSRQRPGALEPLPGPSSAQDICSQQIAASWENSQIFCSALGSQLLEVDDDEEKRHVQAQLRAPSWLGIRDRELEGSWRGRAGTELGPNNSWWHRDEPNGGSLENCAAVGPDGLWADYPCDSNLPWVCEGLP